MLEELDAVEAEMPFTFDDEDPEEVWGFVLKDGWCRPLKEDAPDGLEEPPKNSDSEGGEEPEKPQSKKQKKGGTKKEAGL